MKLISHCRFHLCQDMKTYVSAPNQSCCTAYRRQGLLRDESMQTCHYTLSLRLRNRQGYNHNGRSDCLVHIHLKGMCLLRPVSYMHGKMHLLFPSLSEGLPVSSMRVIQFFSVLTKQDIQKYHASLYNVQALRPHLFLHRHGAEIQTHRQKMLTANT